MLKNFIKIASRSLLRHKGYTFINLIGLAVGMTCCLLIAFYVQDELSYDRYHKNAENIYRVLHAYRNGNSLEEVPPPAPEEFQVWGNAPVARALKADFPEVEKVVRFTSPSSYLLRFEEKRFQENNIVMMDSSVFDVFSWKLLAGDPKTALAAPGSAVLTKRTAEKYFGKRNPVGLTLLLENNIPITVTGVMEDVPAASHFTFDVLISMSSYQQADPEIFDNWGYVDFYTYFTLAEHAKIERLQAKVPGFLKRNSRENGAYTIAFEPMLDAYLYSKAARQPGPTGSLANVYIFSSIGLFILIIACINFMNLATARSLERAKEVGVRKVMGAHRLGLMYQFLTESVILSLLAAVLALLLTLLAIPAVEELTGKAFSLEHLLSWKLLLIVLMAAVLVGVLAGSYPAWVLTRFQPAQVLKGVFKSSPRGIALRKGLVVFQFGLSMALIAGTAIVFFQLNHLRSRDLGFQQEQMLVIDFGVDELVRQKIEPIKQVFVNHPAVLSAAASRAVPGDFLPNAFTQIETSAEGMQGESPLIYEVDVDFIPHFKIEMAAGRPFSRDFPADTANALLLNEAAVNLWGFASAEEAIGKKFSQWGREGTVVGVVKDFNFRSLHKRVEPLTLRPATPGALSRLTLKVQSNHLAATLLELEQLWNQQVPHRPFLYSFLDETFNRHYQSDLRFGKVFSIFALLAIFIACLGLLGLITYTAQQRTKEIGIRKVLGASETSIIHLLAKDFMKLIVLAALLATPAAWYAMHQWLQDFPYRIEIPLWLFLAAGGAAALIALATISYQALKAARANPVKNLRTE